MNARVKVFKDFATNLATLSKCCERQVAAIITDKDLRHVYSIGINGGPKGLMDCMCVTAGKYGCVHAEINCLNANMFSKRDMIMFVTLSPCKACAASIINAPGSFSKVYYVEAWKEDEGLKLLKAAGISVMQI